MLLVVTCTGLLHCCLDAELARCFGCWESVNNAASAIFRLCSHICRTSSAPQVTFKADGPLGGIQVIADARGTVKGKVGNPAADPPLRPDGKLDVGTAVGRGELLTMHLLLSCVRQACCWQRWQLCA